MKQVLTIILITGSAAMLGQSPLNYVNPLIGTAPATTESAKRHGSGTEDKGQTFPGVGRPFGMTQWTPETRTTEVKCVSPYYYNDKYLTGIRASHWMSGSCTQDYGSATFMPFVTARPDTLKVLPASKFSHKNETSAPAYYSVLLESFQVTAEVTATERSAIMRFTFPGKQKGYILIRINSDEKQGKIWFDSTKNAIIGINPVHRIYQGWGKPAGFSGNFYIIADKPIKVTGYLKTSQQLVIETGYETVVTLKAGTSFTVPLKAMENLNREIPSWDFALVRKQAEDAWADALGKIVVRGGSEEDKVKFYTALYHCYQLPRIASDADGSYPGFADDTLVHNTGGFDYYDDFSMWDTYRAQHPLLAIIQPKRTLDMVKSLVLKAEQGGWMPIFPAWSNYTAAMIGDHVSTMIADSYIKGITGFDYEKAYSYMRKNAFETPPAKDYKDGKGRRALESYLEYGYIPMEDSVWDAFHKNEQVSRTLEYALDDYALAQYANAIGREEDYKTLLKRSENWKNVFDRESGFVRGRYADGRWIEPFDPYKKAKYICEGTPYHYTWYVPHDVGGLASAMGGSASMLARLDKFFADGHYWHGNEPGHQVPYMFAMAGDPQKTQKWVQSLIRDEYGTGPGGLSGNEDAGQMSAWLVFSMMGFYPVCPATGEYVVSTPIFDEIRIIPGNGNTVVFTCIGRTAGTNYIKSISRNGGALKDAVIPHEDFVKGGKYTFILSKFFE
jgi:putative alpha-1,2-mannosidase